MNKKTKNEICTHPVSPNTYGVFAMHSLDNRALPVEDVQNIIQGPLTAIQPLLTKEFERIERLENCSPAG